MRAEAVIKSGKSLAKIKLNGGVRSKQIARENKMKRTLCCLSLKLTSGPYSSNDLFD